MNPIWGLQTVLSPMHSLPLAQVEENTAFTWLLRDKSFILPCNFHNNFLVISETDLVLASAFSEKHRSLSALARVHPCGRSGRAQLLGGQPLLPRSSTGFFWMFCCCFFFFKSEFVLRKSEVNYFACTAESSFNYFSKLTVRILSYYLYHPYLRWHFHLKVSAQKNLDAIPSSHQIMSTPLNFFIQQKNATAAQHQILSGGRADSQALQ